MPSGYSILANAGIPADATVVSCPFSLAITPQVAKKSLVKLLNGEKALEGWSERQLLCVYLCFHGIVPADTHAEHDLAHKPYLDTLPSQDKLTTALHFTEGELDQFRGSNLYGAAVDREQSWKAEWEACRGAVAQVNEEWGKAFTWDAYLTTSTYLSSRAFPSTVLSSTPTLQSAPDSHPVLLPGIDSLNHARATPVSWVVSTTSSPPDSSASSQISKESISIVLHRPTRSGGELVNNYGGKPNSELVLGYGFSLPSNPEDTIVLAIGDPREADAGPGKPTRRKWEVGRDARGAEDVWEVVLGKVKGASQGQNGRQDKGNEEDKPPEDEEEAATPAYEDKLEAAQMLADMVETLLDRLPSDKAGAKRAAAMRPEVAQMLHDYIAGQRDILESLLKFAMQKETEAVEEAREAGVELVFE